ncbi:acyltransferase [Sphingomonas sp. AP4-R1]|uniref:acyltransferase family protein n=1 Tax=Sphingomonas sp. AP4-R1 TaxID=2735134 RepID=UPI0020A586BF|nr:acyltransferase [Sphingomonas sp. AP4-R1]
MLQHSILSSYGDYLNVIWGTWWRIAFAPILLMFFGLSGFLVSGSLKKNPTATSFLTLRAVRLVPALAVEVLLSAILLGSIFTRLPLADYFTSEGFWLYLGNMVGWVHRDLPGVFDDLPNTLVNVSLWTLPLELECYAALMLLYVAGFIRKPILLLGVIAVAITVGSALAFQNYDPFWAHTRPLSRSLVVAFLVGVAINLYSDRIRLSKGLALLAVAALIATTIDYRTIYLAAVPAVYLCVYLGMTHPPKGGWLFSGDYSYGLYLFAFPLQQTYTTLFPHARIWYLNFAFTIVFGLLYAAFSWWFVEKPILERKKGIVLAAEGVKDRLRRAIRLAVWKPVTGTQQI